MKRSVNTPCQVDPEFWYPDGTVGTAARAQQAEAARICNTQCPMKARAACLEIAMQAEGDASPENRFGVSGGLSPRQRHQLRQLQRQAQELAA